MCNYNGGVGGSCNDLNNCLCIRIFQPIDIGMNVLQSRDEFSPALNTCSCICVHKSCCAVQSSAPLVASPAFLHKSVCCPATNGCPTSPHPCQEVPHTHHGPLELGRDFIFFRIIKDNLKALCFITIFEGSDYDEQIFSSSLKWLLTCEQTHVSNHNDEFLGC